MDCLIARDSRRPSVVPHPGIALVIGLVVGLSSASTARAEDGPSSIPSLAEISAAIKARNARIESMAVSYTIKAEALGSPQVLSEQMRLVYLENLSVDFAYKKEMRYRKVVEADYMDPLVPDPGKERIRTHGTTQCAFDGKVLRRKMFSQDMADLHRPSLAGDDRHWFPQEYMMNIGMFLPNAFDSASDESRRLYQLPDVLSSGEAMEGPRAEAVEGIPCLVVGIAHRQLFWLDPALGYAVRKIDSFNAKSRLLEGRRRNFDFVEVGPGIWLPKTCWFEWCGHGGMAAPYVAKPMVRYVTKVAKLSINDVPDSQFSLTIDPGMLVVDNRNGIDHEATKAVSYVMPADPAKIDEAIAKALKGQGSSSRWLPVIMWLNVLIVMVLGVVFVYRRRTRAREV
jgi:hypothetical protein